jgi:hypothetical protein
LRRSTTVALAFLSALAFAGAAQAHEFKPAWGYGFIDDSPFNDPASGALLPTTQVFPRGHIRDTLVDERDVRLTVLVQREPAGFLQDRRGRLQGRPHRPAARHQPVPGLLPGV